MSFISELIEYGCSEAGVPHLSKLIDLVWSNKMTRCLGKGGYNRKTGRGTVKLSAKLWPTMDAEQQQDTVLHEVAHVVVDYLHPGTHRLEGNDGHGPTWRRYARMVGAQPVRFAPRDAADFKMYARKVSRFRVLCGCPNGVEITQNRLTKMRKGHRYKCMRCNQPIRV